MSELLTKPLLLLSPHLDDAVLSLGGLLGQHPDVLVVTAFAADPPMPRTGPLATLAAPELRRAEDAEALASLGVKYAHLSHPDAIDRRDASGTAHYPRLEALFGVVHPSDAPLCNQLVEEVAKLAEGRVIVCPMAVGAHVDHQLCAHAGRKLMAAGHTVRFFEDAPYVYPDTGGAVQGDSVMRAAGRLRGRVEGFEDIPIDDLQKSAAVACYRSQVAELFGDIRGFQRAQQSHFAELGGEIERLYRLRF